MRYNNEDFVLSAPNHQYIVKEDKHMSASTERKNRIAAREAGTDKKLNAAQEAAKKAAVSKRRWTIGTIAVILFVALIFFLSSPIMYRITTAETIGTKSYSPADVRYQMASSNYYRMFAYNGELEQAQNILDSSMVQNAALLQYAAENGIALTQQENDFIEENLKTLPDVAASYELSVKDFLAQRYGKGVNESVIRKGLQDGILGDKARMSYYAGLSFTDEDVEAYYAEHEDNSSLYSYALYLVSTDGSTPDVELESTAKEIVNSYNDGKGDAGDAEPLEQLNAILENELGPEAKALVHNDESAGSIPEGVRAWVTGESRQPGDAFAGQSTEGAGWYVVLFLDHTDGSEDVAQIRSIFIGVNDDRDDAAAQARANEILEGWKAGDATEGDFAILANIFSEDNSTALNGGLTTALKPGELGEEADAFCFGERAKGDTTVVPCELNGTQGYLVLYYVGAENVRSAAAKEALANEAMNTWLLGLTEGLEPVRHWAYKLV